MKRGRQSANEAEQTKANILKFSSELFSYKGYQATSLREIAERAGISHGLLRYHFGSKMAIWQAIADMALDNYVNDVIEPALKLKARGALAVLREICRGMVFQSAAHPEVVLIIKQESSISTERLDYFMEGFHPIEKKLRELVEAVKAEGGLTQFDTNFLLITLFGMTSKPFVDCPLIEKTMEISVFEPAYVERYAEQVVTLMFPEV